MDAMCMTMILPVGTAELSYSAADHLINAPGRFFSLRPATKDTRAAKALTFREGTLSVRSFHNEQVAGLAWKFRPFYAQTVFPDADFCVTVSKVFFRVCLNRAAEFAIDVEFDGFPGVVEEPKMNFRRVLPSRDGTVDEPEGEDEPRSHIPPIRRLNRRRQAL